MVLWIVVLKKHIIMELLGFKKPLSCHLYPIRVKHYSSFTAVNYHEWSICSDACSLGKELQKPLLNL